VPAFRGADEESRKSMRTSLSAFALRGLPCPASTAGLAALLLAFALVTAAAAADAPVPLIAKNKPVDWWFVYKFNSVTYDKKRPFIKCDSNEDMRSCPFDPNKNDKEKGWVKGKVASKYGANFSQQYVFAFDRKGAQSKPEDSKLTQGKNCLGTTLTDPVGATFDEIYHGKPNFLVWNDQFYKDPALKPCGSDGNCQAPWGHSKGVLAWNDAGEGVVMQVTTPAWPGSGSDKHPRAAGNTLGCIAKPNNLIAAQHFFALKLNKDGVMAVLQGLANANVVTDWHQPQLARLDGPDDVVKLAKLVGAKPATQAKRTADDMKILQFSLSPTVMLISKPSNLNVPPWQMVSALLGSADERSATWWASPRIPTTTRKTKIGCWEGELKLENKKAGAVVIAESGHWGPFKFGLISSHNHAKVGVTTSGSKHYAIFGDLNQQGTLDPAKKGGCAKSQNARGGLFFVVENETLFKSLSDLLEGKSEPVGSTK
jgi:Deoxyribonuclease II